jgi:putative SOS response-associated peptidase YedK
MRWGLIPFWAKSLSGPPMVNARSETAATTPAFRDPLKFRRCLIPADGFYEWVDQHGRGYLSDFGLTSLGTIIVN